MVSSCRVKLKVRNLVKIFFKKLGFLWISRRPFEDGEYLGGHVYKKRVGIKGRGKSGGVRTLIAFQLEERAFFMYGFAKNKRDNIEDNELKALKVLAKKLLNYTDKELSNAIEAGEIIEVL
ncbi:MAG: hypothetical protein B6247_31500 [Candidatus Parabeggiatoa sp. nov. 2]|nr:MAG: hypothetical protein B6247_31500 [Beggiatoa sp. 4572_84]